MSPIRKAIEAATGAPYTLTIPEPAPGHTAEAIAASIPSQIADLRGDVAKGLNYHTGAGLTAADIPPAYVVPMMYLDRAITGFSGSITSKSDKLEAWQVFELGRRSVKPPNLVALAYEEILRRPADGPGWQHYQDRLDAGEPRYVIVRDIELSPEAQR